MRLRVFQRFDMVVDLHRHDAGLAGDVAADHQHDAELADGVGEAQDGGRDEAGSRQRQRDGEEARPSGPARSVAATSSGRSPIASKAFWIGCTTNGIE